MQTTKIASQSYYDVALEIREEGGESVIGGKFYYDHLAEIGTGRVRQERFLPGAFHQTLSSQSEINMFSGHEKNKPLASRHGGTLELRDTGEYLEIRGVLPPEQDRPSWVIDAIKGVKSGLIRGISPGFRVIKQRFDDAGEYLIRTIEQAALFELSAVSRPAYISSMVELRYDEPVNLDGTMFDEEAQLWRLL